MLFEVRNELDIEKVRNFLEENNILYEERDEAFDSWDGMNLHDTLTDMFDENPTLDGKEIQDLIYQRTPQIVERLRQQYIHDRSHNIEASPALALEARIREFYINVINEEIELMEIELMEIEENN